MKPYWWALGGLVLLAMALAAYVMARPRPYSDCTSSIVIARGSHGEPIECVCVGGAIATCFNPGP